MQTGKRSRLRRFLAVYVLIITLISLAALLFSHIGICARPLTVQSLESYQFWYIRKVESGHPTLDASGLSELTEFNVIEYAGDRYAVMAGSGPYVTAAPG